MISQLDTKPLNQTQSNTTSLVSSPEKSSKGINVKKKKRFDETIIDGFAIIAFKSWEDLQDELNERSVANSINAANNSSAVDNRSNDGTKFDINNKCSTTINKDANLKKSSTKSKSKSSSSTPAPITANSDTTSSTSSSSSNIAVPNSTTSSLIDRKESIKKKDKAKKIIGHSHHNQTTSKEKRNKTSSEKTTLKRALEAKDLAEKRLSILQEKLKQEQNKNRNQDSNHTNNHNNQHIDSKFFEDVKPQHHHNPSANLGDSTKITHEQQSLGKIDHSTRVPYSPYHMNSHLSQRPGTIVLNPMHIHSQDPPSPSRRSNHDNLAHQAHHVHPNPKATNHLGQHLYAPAPPPPTQSQHRATPPPVPLDPSATHQTPIQLPPLHPNPHVHQMQQSSHNSPNLHQPQRASSPMQLHGQQHQVPYQIRNSLQQPPMSISQPGYPNPQSIFPPAQHQSSSPMHPFTMHQPMSSSMMSSMGLGSLSSPYSCPPSIYITDTIRRETSIIPPPSLGAPSLDQQGAAAAALPGSRFGHTTSSVMQSVTPYNPPGPPHNSMYYSSLPAERSFIEFARSYAGPGHVGYSSLMNSFPPPAPGSLSSPYGMWPRLALDHQRAVSRYSNSLYQSTTVVPDRAAYYTSARAPFPAGLFPPPF